MKKLLFLVLALALIIVFPISVSNVYAKETETEITEKLPSEEEITDKFDEIENAIQDNTETEGGVTEKDVTDILAIIEQYKGELLELSKALITFLWGSLGTILSIILFLKKMRGTTKEVNTAVSGLTAQKKKQDEDYRKLNEEHYRTIASLEELQKEIKKEKKEQQKILKDESRVLKELIRLMAVGNKELVANGSSEKITNIINNGASNESETI
ncbi:MAG: hypothetical protein IKA85_06740 [Clostridia bacterium]|nr:hypothetical protein [Clostridia bacterium]